MTGGFNNTSVMMEMNAINSNDNTKDAAVTVRGAYKKYSDSNVVLHGLNMTVKEGTIYGLLGPSGCGKTTLLQCILGVSELDSGIIKVKAKTVADIGYMTQELSLYNELSIIETATFYGRLFSLSDNEIVRRTDELLIFLELPSKTRLIGTLSGGQCRRVSFAIALLHNPQLLILDEPTVGVDPILRTSIWDKLVHMVEMENRTIIVTTHYIEETRQAHTIGLLRNGKLLAENSPSELMTQYNSSSLEDVFLQLCEMSHISSTGQRMNDHGTEGHSNSMSKNTSQVPVKREFKCSWDVVFAVLIKNIHVLKRSSMILVILLLLPFVESSLFSLCIGNDPSGLKLALVNEELPNSLSLNGCNFSVPISCRYIKKLQQKTYELVEYNDIDIGKNAVRSHKVWGLLHFPKNYTASIKERFMLLKKVDGSLPFSEIQIWLDMSNQHIGYMLRRDIFETYMEFLRELFTEWGLPPHLARLPIQMEKPVYGRNNLSLKEYLPLFIASIFHFNAPLLFTVHSLVMEKMNGSFNRCLISGVTVLEIAISHGIVQFLLLCVESAIMMLTLFGLFDNSLLVGNLFWMEVFLLLTSVCGMFYGFLLAAICDSYIAASYVCIGSIFATFVISGTFWPLEGMHRVLRPFSNILPFTQCAKALHALSIKDYPISNPTVYQGFLSNFFWSCAFLFITAILVKKNKLGIK